MPEKVDLNVSPYYDDYDEDKKYHKVLYRPSRPIQARELTQAQSILQNQIERFGDHMFKEGSIITGAESNVDMDVMYVKVESTNPNGLGTTGVENYRTTFDNKYLQGETTGAVAQVVTSYAETSTDPITYIVRMYKSGSDTNNSIRFSAGEELKEVTIDANGSASSASNNNELKIKDSTHTPVGRSSLAEIQEGIIFTRGFFTKVNQQQITLEKYSGAPSYRVGLEIAETLVGSSTDSTLFDNAQGSSNENAAGADRLKIELTLAKHLIDSTTDANFIELMRVNNGIMELSIQRPEYNAFANLLAQRTFDTSGDFIVNQFVPNLKEHLDDGTNGGVYSTINGGDESKFVVKTSAGKAYVKGYQVDKLVGSTIPIRKARSTASLTGASTPVRLGNFVKVINSHGLPEFGNESGTDAQKPYGIVKLFDAVTATPGTENTSGQIGFARIRNFDMATAGTSNSSEVWDNATRFNAYLFDIKMFTKLKYSAHSGTAVVGDKITGSVSGATAIVGYDDGSGALYVHDVVGTFTSADAISSTNGSFAMSAGQHTGENFRGTANEVRTYNIDRVRGISQAPNVTARETFTADIYTDQDFILTGQVSMSSTSVTGFATKFTAELKEGDIVIDGAGNERVISSITSDIAATLTGAVGTALTNANATRRRTRVFDQEQVASIFAWPRDYVKTHTPDQVQVRRSQNVTLSSGTITLTCGSGESFSTRTDDNYIFSVVEAQTSGSPTLVNGDMVDVVNNLSGAPFTDTISGNNLEFSGFPTADDGAILKVTFTVDINSPVNRDKSLKQARCLSVVNSRTTGGFYGTCYNDKEISLGVADVFKVRAIYEGNGATAPLPPSGTITETSSPAIPFQSFEVIKGNTSDARAVIVNYNGSTNKSYFYYTTLNKTFIEGEVLVGQTSKATGNLTNFDQGATNITDRYYFDDGQRDGFYDHGRLQLKPGNPTANNQILVLLDYFTSSGNGDFFDVNSYSGIDYETIPRYVPSKVDLGGLEPDGEFELADAVDFRPVLGQLLGTTTFGSATPNPESPINISNTTSGIVSSPFAYASKSFESAVTGISATGASAVDVPVPGSNVVGDISFYVGRIDKVFLHKDGEFQIAQGTPALTPMKPKGIDDAIELYELRIPPYTDDLKRVRLRSVDHRRFTMKDIGKISNRVANLERLTTLSLLERDTQTMQFKDADGFDRFKSGFVVDSFKGHNVGDVNHIDYNCSVDTKSGVLRPKNFQNFFDIEFDSVNSSEFQKTGDLITLPYTSTTYVNQSKASRAMNVNPYHVFAFIGNVSLTPASDIWQDQTQLPEVRINREGNFDALLAESADLGTVWNAWQTNWVGEPTTVSTEVLSTSSGSWSGDPAQGGEWVSGTEVSREITNTIETQSRTGIRTTVVEDFVEDRNDRVVSISVIPFIRAQTIEIDAVNLKPDSFHYVFFDQQDVNRFVRPFNATYSQDGGTGVTSGIKADGNGRVRAYFDLPNNGPDRFPTGQRDLKVTSSVYNESNPSSGGQAQFSAQGLLQTNQTEIISTRNGRTIVGATAGERQITRRGEQMNSRNVDTDAPPVPLPDPNFPATPPAEPDPPREDPPLPPPPIPNINLPLNIDFDFDFNVFEFGGWMDPLAQSFLVDKSGGMYLTEVDLFFKTKDESLPVSVEIRNMVNGYPGQIILPFSEVTKNPADVNLSQDGSVSTTFTFQSPVFLEQNQEYCFVVLSNSNKYEAFISRMGETDLVTGQTISGQPYAGSLFASQNASTWTAEQTDDLKFHLKYARFDISKRPIVKFNNKALEASPLQNNPIESYAGENYVRVYAYGHGMYDNSSNAVIAGVTGEKTGAIINIEAEGSIATTGTMGSTSTGVATTTDGSGTGCKLDITVSSGSITSIKIADPGFGYTTSNKLTVTNFGSATNTVEIDIDTVDQTIGGIPISCINGTYTAISGTDIDSYTVIPDLSSTDLKTGYVALESTQSGGGNATAQRNYYFDTIHTMIPSVQLKGTLLHTNIRTTAMKSPEGVGGTAYVKNNTAEFITLNDNHFLDQPSIVASPINETNEMASVKSFTCTLQMQSPRGNLSPMIDISSLGALGIMNRLNNIDSSSDVPTGITYVDSTEPDGDNNAFVYCTRKASLATPGTAVKVMLDGFRPSGTDLKVLYKVLENDNSTPFDDIGWRYFNTDGSPDIAVGNDARNFKEYNYTQEGLAEFSAFAIKIVGQSTNTSTVPLVSNLRAIALAT
jgi:hypothetical protein